MKKELPVYISSTSITCSFSKLADINKLKKVFQLSNLLEHSSLGDEEGYVVSDTKVQNLYDKFVNNLSVYGLGFYEVYSDKNEFLGVAGYFVSHGKHGVYPEISIYILPEFQNKHIGHDLASSLINYAFNFTLCKKVVADAYLKNIRSTAAIKSLGFIPRKESRQYKSGKWLGQIRYKLYRREWGLGQLSNIILSQPHSFIPRHFDLANDVARVTHHWYQHFSNGICLTNGGVDESFLTIEDVKDNPNLQTFNMYRSDRPDRFSVTIEATKKFLLEENALSKRSDMTQILTSMCLGGHEGYMRLLRCIRSNTNTGLFFPVGGYGLFAMAAAKLNPVGYNIHFINKKQNTGEKIDIQHLRKSFKLHPKSKTLFIEIKTIAGAKYTTDEIRQIISLCKENKVFLILDIAHINIEFNKKSSFPDLLSLCQEQQFEEFAILYTASKTLGLERGRIGFIVMHKKQEQGLYFKLERDLYRVIGAGYDMPFEFARLLFASSVQSRKTYQENLCKRLYFNMNLMLAYIEGINSKNISSDMKQIIFNSIPKEYWGGIPGISIIYIPEGGVQMKVSMKGLSNTYIANIRMFNSEIFSCALNKLSAVVVISAMSMVDTDPYTLRLSFPITQDVHNGMQGIARFVNMLQATSSHNKYMPNVESAEKLIFSPKHKKVDSLTNDEANVLLFHCKKNIRKKIPKIISFTEKDCDKSIQHAATTIQRFWRYSKVRSLKKPKDELDGLVPTSKL